MAAPTGRPWPVGDLANYVRARLEADPALASIYVQGEITNVFRARSGHVYFTLRDDAGQIKSALFKAQAARSRYIPADGDEAIVFGSVSLYPRDGAIQLYAELVERAGAGLDQLRLELLRRQLEAEGVFDPSRKRPLPPFPRRIGVVTSQDGSVWHDIQHVVARRFPMVELVLASTAVQGDHAPDQIAAALRTLGAAGDVDVIIVGRGGGSAEDLAAFNSEVVARAVFASPVPTVSAVGHETDWSICDLVADVRAATPSAAAEIVTPSSVALRQQLGEYRRRLAEIAETELRGARLRRETLGQRLRLLSPAGAISRERIAVDARRDRLDRTIRDRVAQQGQAVAARRTVLAALDPGRVLGRGYSVVSGSGDAVVTAAGDVRAGDAIRVRTADGEFGATVDGPGIGDDRAADGHRASDAAPGNGKAARPRERRGATKASMALRLPGLDQA